MIVLFGAALTVLAVLVLALSRSAVTVTLAVSWDLLALSGLAGLATALAVFALGCLLLAVALAGWWLWRAARYLRQRLANRRDPMYYERTR